MVGGRGGGCRAEGMWECEGKGCVEKDPGDRENQGGGWPRVGLRELPSTKGGGCWSLALLTRLGVPLPLPPLNPPSWSPAPTSPQVVKCSESEDRGLLANAVVEHAVALANVASAFHVTGHHDEAVVRGREGNKGRVEMCQEEGVHVVIFHLALSHSQPSRLPRTPTRPLSQPYLPHT